jgi:hypothetical protein
MDSVEKHLDDPMVSAQARRHTEEELGALERWVASHPEDHHDPTGLELYCNDNPDALECRVYDD